MRHLTQHNQKDDLYDQKRVNAEGSGDPLVGPLTVLVVDEDDDLRVYLLRCLDQFGPLFGPVVEASNGLEALSVVRTSSVDLLICGSHLPQMSSEALCAAIRADDATASILIVVLAETGPDSSPSQTSDLRFADAILESPFNAAGVGACLGRLIHSS